jgi:hypothetical protein
VQYALLIYHDPDVFANLPDEERQASTAEYFAIREDPRVTTGAGLQGVETATTLREQLGETLVTDGPYANTKEVFAGYYLVDADDLDSALEVARRIPALKQGGAVEVRPLMEYST